MTTIKRYDQIGQLKGIDRSTPRAGSRSLPLRTLHRTVCRRLCIGGIACVALFCTSNSVPAQERKPNVRTVVARASFTNHLGMVFVTLPGTNVCFSVWQTRVKDFVAYVNNMQVSEFTNHASDGSEDDLPMVNVNWYDACAFCGWLTRKERRLGVVPPELEYRLPTDFEWSLAAGVVEKDKSILDRADVKYQAHVWGYSWPPPMGFGNFGSKLQLDEFEGRSPVGSFPPNQVGLFDLGSNVNEWCMDQWVPWRSNRVERGASYRDADKFVLRLAARVEGAPEHRSPETGFRVVLAPVGSADSVEQ